MKTTGQLAVFNEKEIWIENSENSGFRCKNATK